MATFFFVSDAGNVVLGLVVEEGVVAIAPWERLVAHVQVGVLDVVGASVGVMLLVIGISGVHGNQETWDGADEEYLLPGGGGAGGGLQGAVHLLTKVVKLVLGIEATGRLAFLKGKSKIRSMLVTLYNGNNFAFYNKTVLILTLPIA